MIIFILQNVSETVTLKQQNLSFNQFGCVSERSLSGDRKKPLGDWMGKINIKDY